MQEVKVKVPKKISRKPTRPRISTNMRTWLPKQKSTSKKWSEIQAPRPRKKFKEPSPIAIDVDEVDSSDKKETTTGRGGRRWFMSKPTRMHIY